MGALKYKKNKVKTNANVNNKESTIEVEGTVVKALPNAMFEVVLENSHKVLASISGKIRTNNIKILLGDVVNLEMSVYDLTRARIYFRKK